MKLLGNTNRVDGNTALAAEAASDTWTAKDVASYLRISTRQVRNLAHKGQLPGVKIGSDWRFNRQTILALMKGGTS